MTGLLSRDSARRLRDQETVRSRSDARPFLVSTQVHSFGEAFLDRAPGGELTTSIHVWTGVADPALAGLPLAGLDALTLVLRSTTGATGPGSITVRWPSPPCAHARARWCWFIREGRASRSRRAMI